MGMLVRLLKISMLVGQIITSPAHALDWGHFVTGTTDQLKKGQTTIGTTIVGHGVNDSITLGTSPIMYLGYEFFSILTRLALYQKNIYKLGTDIFYFVSNPNTKESSLYDQESWYLRINQTITINPRFRIHASANLQYFIKENSTYSLRSDPLGRWVTFQSKVDQRHQEKLQDFRQNRRDPKTISLSLMPSFYLTSSIFLNLEYGILGTNYDQSLNHYGASLNIEWKTVNLTLGVSKSSRKLSIGQEDLNHFESKLQYYF
jgi:hypothetical protein